MRCKSAGFQADNKIRRSLVVSKNRVLLGTTGKQVEMGDEGDLIDMRCVYRYIHIYIYRGVIVPQLVSYSCSYLVLIIPIVTNYFEKSATKENKHYLNHAKNHPKKRHIQTHLLPFSNFSYVVLSNHPFLIHCKE